MIREQNRRDFYVTSRAVTVTVRAQVGLCLHSAAQSPPESCGDNGERTAVRTARGRPLLRANPDRVGRVQRQVRRAFIAKGSPLRMGALLAHCYPRDARWQRNAVHRALKRFGVPLGRVARRGRPMLWGLAAVPRSS
jgi:hypothetical protein